MPSKLSSFKLWQDDTCKKQKRFKVNIELLSREPWRARWCFIIIFIIIIIIIKSNDIGSMIHVYMYMQKRATLSTFPESLGGQGGGSAMGGGAACSAVCANENYVDVDDCDVGGVNANDQVN